MFVEPFLVTFQCCIFAFPWQSVIFLNHLCNTCIWKRFLILRTLLSFKPVSVLPVYGNITLHSTESITYLTKQTQICVMVVRFLLCTFLSPELSQYSTYFEVCFSEPGATFSSVPKTCFHLSPRLSLLAPRLS